MPVERGGSVKYPLRVILAEDDVLLRAGLASLLANESDRRQS